MKITVTLSDDRTLEFDSRDLGAGNEAGIPLPGGERLASLVESDDRRIVLEVDGRRHAFEVERDPDRPGEITLVHEHRTYRVSVQDELEASRAASGGASASRGPAELSSSLPGVVRQIFKKVGDEVAAGEAVLTLEAMKMENEIVSPVSGRLDLLEVEPGAVVAARQRLARVTPDASES